MKVSSFTMDKFVIRKPKRPAPDPAPDQPPAPLQLPQGSLSPPPSTESDLSELTSTELQKSNRDQDTQPPAKKTCFEGM